MLGMKLRSLFLLPVLAVAVLGAVLLPGSSTSAQVGAAGLDHFTCYPVNSSPFAQKTAQVRDQFEDKTTQVRGTRGLCAPTDKNG